MQENMTVTRDPKTSGFNFDWPKDLDEKLKHEIEFIIERNESLAWNKIKNEIEQSLSKYVHEHRKQQNNKPHKFVLNLSQRLDLKSAEKYVHLQNLFIYCTGKNIRKQYKNNKLKIIAPAWNDEFELPDVFILFQIFKIILSTSLKTIKH